MRDRPKPRYVEKLPPDKTQSTQATTSYKDS